MGARLSAIDNIPNLRKSDKNVLYLPPKCRKSSVGSDSALGPGTVVQTKDAAPQLRRRWIHLGFETILKSKVGVVVLDAFAGDARQSVLYFIGQRVRRICSLSAPPTSPVIPRIPVFVFPRSIHDRDSCQQTLLEAGLPINDIIIAHHSVTRRTLAKSPLLERMVDRGLDFVHVVDCSNYFEIPCDPLLLGFAAENGYDFCGKVLKRDRWDEDYPLYVLKIVLGYHGSDADEMSAVVDAKTCDQKVLQMGYEDFYAFRGKSKTRDPGSMEASPPEGTDHTRLAFGYSALPSFVVATKVLHDCQKRRKYYQDITEYCQQATSMLVLQSSIASTYQKLEEFFEFRTGDVRDDSLLVILSMSQEWEDVSCRSYDNLIDERLDNIKEYGDRGSVYQSQSPRFDTWNLNERLDAATLLKSSRNVGWKNPFRRFCCLDDMNGAITVDSMDLATNEFT